jgi:putative flippase GtrA
LLIEKTHSVKIQFLRYLIVGFIAFGVDFATLYILTDIFGVHYLLSNVFGFILGLLSNYYLSIKWVFAHRKMENRKKEFFAFTAIGVIGLLINQLVMWSLTDLAEVYYLYSKIAATGVVFFWNFFARRYGVFY